MKLRVRFPRGALTATRVARLLEEAYDDARATLDLAEAGDATITRRAILRAEAIVGGCEEARLTPDRPWRDDTPSVRLARRREAQAGAVRVAPRGEVL